MPVHWAFFDPRDEGKHGQHKTWTWSVRRETRMEKQEDKQLQTEKEFTLYEKLSLFFTTCDYTQVETAHLTNSE